MNGLRDFDAALRSWLRRTAPREAPARVLAAALARAADEPQRHGWLASLRSSTRRRVVLRGAAVALVIVLAIVAGLRLANLGPDVGGPPVPSGSALAEGSVPPSEVGSVICEAFADGGPMDKIAFGPSDTPDDVRLGRLSDGAAGLAALAQRASGDEREGLLALATTVNDFTAALGAATSYSSEELQALPPDVRDALEDTIQNAFDALQDAEPAFYRKYYVEHCSLDLDAPPTVDCGPIDQVTCDRVVAEFIAGRRQVRQDGSYVEGQGAPPDLPVLTLVFGSPCSPGGYPADSAVYWPGGGVVAQGLCGGGDPPPTPTAIVGSPDVGVPYQVALHDCTVDFPLGDTWWRFENAGPTPGPIIPDTVGTVRAIVTLTSPDTAILRTVDGSEHMLILVDEPIEASCY